MNKISPYDLIFLAVMPVLFQLSNLSQSVVTGICVGLGWLITGLFFKTAAEIFPKAFLKVAILVGLLSLGQAGWYLFKISPVWILGVWIFAIASAEDAHAFQIKKRTILLQGVMSTVICVFLGSLYEFSNRYVFEGPRVHPALSFLFLAFIFMTFRRIFRSSLYV